MPSLDAVVIEDDVPVPCRWPHIEKQDWTPLLKKLQPKQSFALPLHARHVLSTNVTALHKASAGNFTIRTYPSTQQLRVWRIS